MTGKPITKNPNAVALGRLGGSKKSEKKRLAVTKNGFQRGALHWKNRGIKPVDNLPETR